MVSSTPASTEKGWPEIRINIAVDGEEKTVVGDALLLGCFQGHLKFKSLLRPEQNRSSVFEPCSSVRTASDVESMTRVSKLFQLEQGPKPTNPKP